MAEPSLSEHLSSDDRRNSLEKQNEEKESTRPNIKSSDDDDDEEEEDNDAASLASNYSSNRSDSLSSKQSNTMTAPLLNHTTTRVPQGNELDESIIMSDDEEQDNLPLSKVFGSLKTSKTQPMIQQVT